MQGPSRLRADHSEWYPFADAVVMVLSLSTDSLFVGLRAMQALPNGLGGSACFFFEIRTLLLTASR